MRYIIPWLKRAPQSPVAVAVLATLFSCRKQVLSVLISFSLLLALLFPARADGPVLSRHPVVSIFETQSLAESVQACARPPLSRGISAGLGGASSKG